MTDSLAAAIDHALALVRHYHRCEHAEPGCPAVKAAAGLLARYFDGADRPLQTVTLSDEQTRRVWGEMQEVASIADCLYRPDGVVDLTAVPANAPSDTAEMVKPACGNCRHWRPDETDPKVGNCLSAVSPKHVTLAGDWCHSHEARPK